MKWTSNHVMLVFLKKLKTATTNPDANCVLDIFVVFEEGKLVYFKLRMTITIRQEVFPAKSATMKEISMKILLLIVAHWVSLEV